MSQRYPTLEGNKSSNLSIYLWKTDLAFKNDFLCPESFSATKNLHPLQSQLLRQESAP